MGKKSTSVPDMPDVPEELYTALENQADVATNLGNWWDEDMYPWYKDTTETANETYQSIVNNALSDADWYRNWAKDATSQATAIRDAYYNNWQENYLPIEQQLIEDAQNYNSDAYAEQQAQAAIGDIAASYANQRQQTAINMSKYGVDPTSGQYMGQMNALGVNQAAASAAAANSARQAAIELGWSKNMELANLGLQYANLTNSATSGVNNTVATGSGATTSSENVANTSNAGITTNLYNLANTGLNSYQTLANAWGSVASGYNSLYGNQVGAWSSAAQAASSNTASWNSLIGGLAGAGASLYTGSKIGSGLTAIANKM